MGSYRGLVISGVLAIAAVALAQPKPNADQLKQAGELVHKAIAKSQAGDHVLAIELYQQAYNVSLFTNPNVVAVKGTVGNFKPNPTQTGQEWNSYEWWFDKSNSQKPLLN